jgi:hypothetical protein
MKKIGLLLLIMALGVWGCVTVDNSTIVDADQNGAATGQFRDIRHGKVCDFGVYGGGLAASAAGSNALFSAASNGLGANSATQANTGPSSGGGGGFFGLRVRPAPAQGDPLPFARSIAMINYAKKLKKVSYDDCGLVSFEFNDQGPARPAAFGHQPIK